MRKPRAAIKHETHIDVLDGLRGIAILMVMWLHIWELSWLSIKVGPVNLDFIPVSGFMGVELFFFISGFCLFIPYARHLIHGDEMQTLRAFAYKRAIKILPSYYLSILLVILIFGLKVEGVRQWLYYVGTHLIFIQNLFPETQGAINGVLWSLGVEVQFYVLFPLVCWLFRKQPWLVFLGMCAVAIGYRSYNVAHNLDNIRFLNGQLPGFLDIFACGMLAAYLLLWLRRRFPKLEDLKPYLTVLAMVMFAAMLAMLHWIYDIRYEPNGIELWKAHNRFYMGLIFMVLTLSSALSLGAWKKLLANRVQVFLSLISYNLYIWHQFIARKMVLWRLPAFQGSDPHNDPAWQWLYTPLAFAVSIAFAAILTYVFERPLLKKGVLGAWDEWAGMARRLWPGAKPPLSPTPKAATIGGAAKKSKESRSKVSVR